MNTINGMTYNGSAPVNQAQSNYNNDLGQRDFLRLMVAQVRNQDPMDPQTNGDFLAQLAQFSTNDGISKMQESMEQMASSLQSNQALQATSLVGKKVLVNSNAMQLEPEGDSKLAIDVPAPVKNVRAFIYSDKGELVRTISLGDRSTGQFDYSWDGLDEKGERMTAGKYTLRVSGVYEGKEVGLKTMTASNVDSVSLGNSGEGVKINVAGVGTVSLNDVRQITA